MRSCPPADARGPRPPAGRTSSQRRTARRARGGRHRGRALARGRDREAGAKDRGEAEPWIELQRDEQNGADDDEEAADRERRVEVLLELRVDGKRQRLRHPLQAAGEYDRRAEL